MGGNTRIGSVIVAAQDNVAVLLDEQSHAALTPDVKRLNIPTAIEAQLAGRVVLFVGILVGHVTGQPPSTLYLAAIKAPVRTGRDS